MAAGISVKLSLNDSLFQAGIKRAGAAVARFGVMAAKVGAVALGAQFVAAGVTLGVMTKKVINLGDDLLRMKRITGLSVSSLFILREAFEQAGTSAESIGPVIGKMQKNIFAAAKGGGTLHKSLAAVGIDIRKLAQMKPEDQFALLGKTINSLPDMQRQALAMDIFGRAGLQLLPVFAELKDFDSTSLKKQAAIIEKNADAFDNANDAIRRMKTNVQGLFVGLAEKVAPMIANIGKRLEGVDFVAMGDKLADNLLRGVQVGLALFQDPIGVMKAFWAQAKVYVLQFGNWLIDAIDGAFPGIGVAILDAIDKTVAWGNIIIGTAVQFGQVLVASVETFAAAIKKAWDASGIPNAISFIKANASKLIRNEATARAAGAVAWMQGASDDQQLAIMDAVRGKKSGISAGAEGNIAGLSAGAEGDASSWGAKMTRIQTGSGAAMVARGNAALANAARGIRKFTAGADHLGVAAAEAAAALAKNKAAPAMAKAAEQMKAVGLIRGMRGWDPGHIKQIDTFGTGNWRKASASGTLRGASMAGTLSGAFGSTKFGGSSLQGASLIGGMAGGAGAGDKLRSSGMINSAHKRRVEAFERKKEKEGLDKTNDLLGGIKQDIHQLLVMQE